MSNFSLILHYIVSCFRMYNNCDRMQLYFVYYQNLQMFYLFQNYLPFSYVETMPKVVLLYLGTSYL